MILVHPGLVRLWFLTSTVLQYCQFQTPIHVTYRFFNDLNAAWLTVKYWTVYLVDATSCFPWLNVYWQDWYTYSRFLPAQYTPAKVPYSVFGRPGLSGISVQHVLSLFSWFLILSANCFSKVYFGAIWFLAAWQIIALVEYLQKGKRVANTVSFVFELFPYKQVFATCLVC